MEGKEASKKNGRPCEEYAARRATGESSVCDVRNGKEFYVWNVLTFALLGHRLTMKI